MLGRSMLMAASNAAADWTPANLSTVAWWDASDASSFTFSSGTVVQDWRSMSGSYTLTQVTSANRPSRSGTVNGLSTVVFDGSNDGLSVDSFDLTSGGQKFSVWVVFSATANNTVILAEQTTNYNNTAGAFVFVRESDNKVNLVKKGTGVEYAQFATTGTVTTTPKAFVGTHDGTLSTNETSGRLNGDTGGTRPNNANTNSNNVSATLYVGSRANSSLFINGQICELGITATILTNTEITDLEAYLSQKWGLGF